MTGGGAITPAVSRPCLGSPSTVTGRLERVGLVQHRSDDLHAVLGGGGAKRFEVEVGERREPVEESLHAGGRERKKKSARPLAYALPGMCQPPRDEDEG